MWKFCSISYSINWNFNISKFYCVYTHSPTVIEISYLPKKRMTIMLIFCIS